MDAKWCRGLNWGLRFLYLSIACATVLYRSINRRSSGSGLVQKYWLRSASARRKIGITPIIPAVIPTTCILCCGSLGKTVLVDNVGTDCPTVFLSLSFSLVLRLGSGYLLSLSPGQT